MLVICIAFFALAWAARQAPVELPDAVVNLVSEAITRQLKPYGFTAQLGEIDISLRANFAPALGLRHLRITDASGQETLKLESLETVFSRDDLLIGRAAPVSLAARGLRLALLRDGQGRLTLRLGDATVVGDAPSPGAVLARVREVLAQRHLAHLRTVGLEQVAITLDDTRDGRRLTSRNGSLRIVRRGKPGTGLTMDVDLGVFDEGGQDMPGRIALHLDSAGPDTDTDVRVTLRGLEPARLKGLAGPGPLSGFLARLRAPVSLALQGGIAAEGDMMPMTGRLQVGAGVVLPVGQVYPIEINYMRADLNLTGDFDHLAITGFSLDSAPVSIRGRLDLRRDPGSGTSVQMAMQDIRLELPHGDTEAAPVRMDRLWSDMRYDHQKDTITVASLTVEQDGARVYGHGRVDSSGSDTPARLSLDLTADRLDRAQLLALWPAFLASGSRDWVEANVDKADLTDAHLSIRRLFGGDPALRDPAENHLALDFGFSDAVIRAARGLPPVTGAAGHGALANRQFAIKLQSGQSAAPGAGPVSLRDGVVQIAKLGTPGGPLDVDVTLSAAAPDALAMMRQPLFQARGKRAAAHDAGGAAPAAGDAGGAAPAAGDSAASNPLMAPGAVTGEVTTRLTLQIPIGPQRDQVAFKFDVAGTIDDVKSDVLVRGHALAAEQIQIAATPELLQIWGPGTLDGEPLTMRYTRPLRTARALGQTAAQAPSPTTARTGVHSDAPPPPGNGKVTATVPLTDAIVRRFGIKLPKGTLRGAGSADVVVDLGSDGPPELRLTADLAGLGISVPAIGLAKAPAASGRLEVEGRLGPAAEFNRISLSFPGADVTARARLREGGKLEAITLDRAVLGRWLDVAARFTPARAGQQARLALTGGTVDLRHLPKFGRGGGAGGGGRGGGLSIGVALDRIRLTDSIAMTGVTGALSQKMHGRLSARVNGGAPINLRLAPGPDPGAGGIALQLTGSDAGAILRDTGLLKVLNGGSLDLRLVPRGGPGGYRGQLRIADTALVDGPTAAKLVAAVSVIGATEELEGKGIRFSDVRAEFVLDRRQIDLMSASATGPSLGVSLDGIVDLANRRLNLQGVVSPLYFLNRIGSFMTRRGEGLFGAHYTVTGPLNSPRLAVNLLSVLTPGFLREVFRGQHGRPGQDTPEPDPQ